MSWRERENAAAEDRKYFCGTTNCKKTVLALLAQCKDDDLTVEEALFYLDTARAEIGAATYRAEMKSLTL